MVRCWFGVGILLMWFITAINCEFSDSIRCANIPHLSHAHIAIGFYGVSRNLSNVLYTFDVFKVLDRANITYDVFSTTMGTHSASSSRDSTRGLHVSVGSLDPYDIRLLRPCRFSILDQERVRMREFSLFSTTRGMLPHNLSLAQFKHFDEFDDGFKSVRNALCSYYSQSELGAMIVAHAQVHGIKYDAVLALRPDTAIARDIDLSENLAAIREHNRTLWVPNFQHWWGYNDRMAYGSLPAMSVYLERGQLFRNAPGKFHLAERLVKYALDTQNITVKFSTARVIRVRQNGEVAEKKEYMDMTNEEWNRCVTGTHLLSESC